MTAATRHQLAEMHDALQFAISCREPAFKIFLHEQKGFSHPMSDDQAVANVLSLLGIRSREEVRSDEAAAEQWRLLVEDFRTWRIS
ncbi:hypothetical protein FHX08_002041 [Rhizobium sp. BK529]|uniref:hypothetical protein n=1 Tax=Rhizobium sp. BK529 TaxID=2586983 RepID=UPI0016192657|nr:hypothetical protein [Rhizobium sp. BK529]MBB3591697.1 hypothetical protein [Rhizobium sp. BK529]